jgi:pimeloyl-ACP methyl ester carboxylesterase
MARWGRRLAVALAAVVLLVVVLVFGGGWYFAGQIDSEALATPQHASVQHYDYEIDGYADGQVQLHRRVGAQEHDPLQSDKQYGLVWPDGAGVLTGPPQPRSGGGPVQRALQVVAGRPPSPGTEAALRQDVWTDPHAAYGVAFQEVTYPCAGGECPAWFVPGKSTTWLITVHGKGASRTEPLRAMGPALHAGLPVLDLAYRNDAGAPADPAHRYGWGATEWHDLEQAVRYATDHGAQHVVLFGSSMGGAVVASFLQHSSSASLVRGVVLDAPALDLRSIVEFGAAQRRTPVIGTKIPGVVTWAAEQIAGLRYDVDWQRLDYVDGSWLHVPLLVFHGTADGTVPISVSDRLRAAHPGLVQEVRVPGAGHVESWNVDPQGYAARESTFLGCVTAAAAPTHCPAVG